MFIKIGVALSVMAKYVQRRGDSFQFCMRVPSHLHKAYGKERIRISLNTTEAATAFREAEKLARKYEAEFKVLADGVKATPADLVVAGEALADQYDLGTFIDFVAEPLRRLYANGDEHIHDLASPSDYLSPQQVKALEVLQTRATPQSHMLSDAFDVYMRSHQRGNDATFVTKQKRDWDTLIDVIGNIEFDKLSRDHSRHVIDVLSKQGKKTATVRRTVTVLSAVAASAIREWSLVRTNPFEKVAIQGEGKDAKETTVAGTTQLKQIVQAMRPLTTSAPALLALMQLEMGTRIGELAGLAVSDVVLDHEVPHIVIREQPWRTLKTKVSIRHVPLMGVALEAVKHALTLPRKSNGYDQGQGLFSQYAKPKGNDSASAAVNKRIKKWGLSSHSFRHTMEDRLREVGCPEDVRNAIQGHTNGSAAEQYGKGHSLKVKQGWLQKVVLSTDTAI